MSAYNKIIMSNYGMIALLYKIMLFSSAKACKLTIISAIHKKTIFLIYYFLIMFVTNLFPNVHPG